MIRFLIRVLMLLLVLSGTSQTPSFKHLTNADGLSENWVRQVIKDARGYIWIATSQGLDRYDGYNLVNYDGDQEDTLSLQSNDIYCLFVDSKGQLLIGSKEGGVAMFDYHNQQFFNYDLVGDLGDQLVSQSVMNIEESEGGYLLFGTYGNGLFILDPDRQHVQQQKAAPEFSNALLNNWITFIQKQQDGTFLIGSLDGGLSRLSIDQDGNCQFSHYKATLGKSVYTATVMSSGELWVGTGGTGVIKYENHLDLDASARQYVFDENDPNSLTANFISDIVEDDHGEIWIGSSASGLDRYDRNIDGFKHYNEKSQVPNLFLSVFDLWDIHQDAHGNLWVASGGNGLYRYDRSIDQFELYQYRGILEEGGMSAIKLRNIYEEDNGTIWIGTFSGGVSLYSKYNSFFSKYQKVPGQPASLSNSSIISFGEMSDDEVWVGTDGGGVNVFNPKTREVVRTYTLDQQNPKSLGSNNVLKIMKDHAGVKWVGTWGGGLNRFNEKDESFDRFNTDYVGNSLISNHVWQLEEDRKGRLWVGTILGGLHLMKANSKEFERFYVMRPEDRLAEEDIWSICEDSRGAIWIGGRYLTKVIERDGKFSFKTYRPNEQDSCLNITSKLVTAIHEDAKGKLWVAVNGTGLCQFDREKECFTCLSEEEGLSNTNVSGIVESDGFLWIGTNDGLFRLDLDDLSFIHFDRSDGLQSNIFAQGACMKDSKGHIYFGGANGMNVFDPSVIELDSTFTRIAFTDFKVFNKSVAIGTENEQIPSYVDELSQVVLTSHQQVFSIEYAALNYVAPEKIEYAYMLEGFDQEWNYVGKSRVATYTNLDPGTYTFKVKSTNHSRLWNADYRELKVVIIPPIYKTFWFRSLALVVIALIIYTYIQLRMKRSKRNQQLLEMRVRERTEKLSAEIEQRILTEVELSNALSELKDTQSRLVQSEKLASVGRFVSGIAHELNNPLNYIQGGLEMIKNQDAVEQGISLVGEGFKRSSKIVKSLTSISFNNTNQLKGVSVDEITQHALQNLKKLAEGIQNLEILSELTIKVPMMIYPDMLHTAIEKILENAIYETAKMPVDQREIVIKTFYCEESRMFMIRVFNQGPQIPANIRTKIFDPFFTTKDPGEGPGLGLAVAYYFVKQHNGEIEVVNLPNGVEFVVSIPAKVAEHAASI